jgi:hypothetical protein
MKIKREIFILKLCLSVQGLALILLGLRLIYWMNQSEQWMMAIETQTVEKATHTQQQ